MRTQTGHDFSAYKTNTIQRRINRRMGLNQIDTPDSYVRYLRENPEEIHVLFRELLIGVTSFFRDPESFDILKKEILPGVFKGLENDATFRVWVPGCSSGEEVYSIAIVLHEYLQESSRRVNLQLFGTDIAGYAIEKAREGLYPATIALDVDEHRLKRYFTQKGDYFRINKEIRNNVVFSIQDITADPPFSRLNMLCCRNLLIYLNSETQKRLLPLFHYTLNPGGILMLSSSESIGEFGYLFEVLNKKWKIFKRSDMPETVRPQLHFPRGFTTHERQPDTDTDIPGQKQPDIVKFTQKAILDEFAPAAVLVDAKGDIVHVQGRTGKYLEAPSGPPNRNILDMAREGLRLELSSALRSAKSSGDKITRPKVTVKTNGKTISIKIHVSPQKSPQQIAGTYLVVFEEMPDYSSAETGSKGPGEQDTTKIEELERELHSTRQSHQTTIEELETSNEELKSTNQELQSSNEEMQSTNEELESSKEELQSLNEELQTVNTELENKIEELSAAHDDMRNLLNSTSIATIFVDNKLCVRRFTPEASEIVNLIQSDIGRPLEHVMNNLTSDTMINDLEEVLEKLIPKETEVQTKNGKWHTMRIMPYRTTDNHIDGAVLTFSSIDDQKNVQKQLKVTIREKESALKIVQTVFEQNDNPMMVLDENAYVVFSNKALDDLLPPEHVTLKGHSLLEVLPDMPDAVKLESRLKKALKKKHDFKAGPFDIPFNDGSRRVFIKGDIVEFSELPYRIILRFIRKESGA